MNTSSRIHAASLAQFLLSGLGLLAAFGVLSAMAVMWIAAVMGEGAASPEAFLAVSLAWTTGFVTLLLLPSAILALLRLIQREVPQSLKRLLEHKPGTVTLVILPVAWALLVLAGEFLSRNSAISWLLMPPIQILVVSIPLWGWFMLARRGMKNISQQRKWGLVSFGLVVSPALIMLVELLLVGFLAVILILWLVSQPGIAEELNRLTIRLANAQMNPEVVMRILRPYIETPGVLVSVLVIAAVLIPLLEELLKPLGMWLLARRLETPQEGFIAGLLCGSMFGLLENLGMLASPITEGWAGLVIGRTGTGLLHAVTSGLVGWGLVAAWRQRRYLHMAGAYLLAVLIHGLWNMVSVFTAAGLLVSENAAGSQLLVSIGKIAPWALACLAAAIFLALLMMNRHLNKQTNQKLDLNNEGFEI